MSDPAGEPANAETVPRPVPLWALVTNSWRRYHLAEAQRPAGQRALHRDLVAARVHRQQEAAASRELNRARGVVIQGDMPDDPGTSSSAAELVQGVEDLPGFGAGAVIGVDVDPPYGAAGVEDDGGGHRQGDGAVGVDAGQVESELQLGGAGLA